MRGFERPPPPSGQDFKSWAERLSDYLVRVQSRLSFAGGTSDAVPPDGGIFWDTAGYPVVSTNGEYRQVVLAGDYGFIARTSDATAAAVNTAYPLEFSTPPVSGGLSLGTPASRIVFLHGGIYQVDFSAQIASSTSSLVTFFVWLEKNATDVPFSAVFANLQGSGRRGSMSRQVLVEVDAGDYIELEWATNNTNGSLHAEAGTAFSPAAPAATIAITKVQR